MDRERQRDVVRESQRETWIERDRDGETPRGSTHPALPPSLPPSLGTCHRLVGVGEGGFHGPYDTLEGPLELVGEAGGAKGGREGGREGGKEGGREGGRGE